MDLVVCSCRRRERVDDGHPGSLSRVAHHVRVLGHLERKRGAWEEDALLILSKAVKMKLYAGWGCRQVPELILAAALLEQEAALADLLVPNRSVRRTLFLPLEQRVAYLELGTECFVGDYAVAPSVAEAQANKSHVASGH